MKSDTGLKRSDRGYISMPLFHSNAWYIGILPQMITGGSFVLKRRFSARAFEEDMLEHGVRFMNYVGQPLHYILDALEKKYGGIDEVEKALASHPRNRFRIAYGNGAPAVDRQKLMRCLGMEHIYEIYGSTEAVITTANRRATRSSPWAGSIRRSSFSTRRTANAPRGLSMKTESSPTTTGPSARYAAGWAGTISASRDISATRRAPRASSEAACTTPGT